MWQRHEYIVFKPYIATMDGVVTEVNEALVDMPEEINDHPYKAWIFKFKPAETSDIKQLLSAEAYQALFR